MAGFAHTARPAQRLSGDFWKFWIGQAVSNLGSSFGGFALPLIVFRLTGSAVNLAISSAAGAAPMLLFGLIIGAWVDRVDRRRLMIGTDIARSLVIASIPLLTAFGFLSVGWIYVVGFISSTLTLFFSFAQVTAVASLVTQEDLVTANGRIQASYSATSAIGPLLAGLLVAVMPVPSLLLLDALSFLVSAGSLALIRTSFNPTGAAPPLGLGRAVGEGLSYVLRHPVMGPVAALAALITFAGSPVGSQLVLFAKERLHASDAKLGLLYSSQSVGVILFSLAAGSLRKRWSFSQMILGAMGLYGAVTIILALTPWYWAAVFLLGLRAGAIMIFNISVISLRQAIVPNMMLGRVSSTLNVLVNAASPFGSLIGGWAIERTQNVALVYGACGSLQFLIALVFSFTQLAHAQRYLSEAKKG